MGFKVFLVLLRIDVLFGSKSFHPSGEECELAYMYPGINLEAGCRPDYNNSTLCNSRGDCFCGKCECYPRENGEEVISGEYCECDNFSCDRYNGDLCSGPDHGECICGNCKCNSEWEVEGYTACECRASNETCITPYGEHINKLCSGHGTCECGQCKCEESEDGQYAGKYCEDCASCKGKCEELKACVQCQIFGSGELFDQVDEFGVDKCSLCPFESIMVDNVYDYVKHDRKLCYFIDDDSCLFSFAYGYRRQSGDLEVFSQVMKECPQPHTSIANINSEIIELFHFLIGVFSVIF